MKKYFCCPECGSEDLTLIKDEKQFSVAKAFGWWFLIGVWGILFAYLFGQTDTTVSMWSCNCCRHKFKRPDEAIVSINKNSKSANVAISIAECVLIAILVVLYVVYMCGDILTSVVVFSLFNSASDSILISIIASFVIFVVLILIIAAASELVRYFVNKYFAKKLSVHNQNLKRMASFSGQTDSFEYNNADFGQL